MHTNFTTRRDLFGFGFGAALALASGAAAAQGSPPPTNFGQHWVAHDGLGRALPTETEVGLPRANRYVGVFYWLWHGYIRTSPIRDVTLELAAHPDNPQFTFQDWYWGEPEGGYYHASDPWVVRRNLQMLADAGVDFIFFDFTNGPIGKESFEPFMVVAEDMRASGIPVPRFAFFLNSDGKNTLDWLYANLYQPKKHADFWFEWEGKPLVMADPSFASSPEIQNFFTFRHTWAFQSEQHDEWRFVDDYPQRPSWHVSADQPEQICVSKSMGAPLVPNGHVNSKGASFHDGIAPTYDAQWLSADTPKGLFFAEQWQRALEVDPPLVLVTGWNELTAGAWNADQGIADNYSFLGKPIGLGGWYYVDEFNAEFNRDLEPMTGGYTDNYYYQLVANIRRYKGVEAAPSASPAAPIAIDGSFGDWHDVLPVYRDAAGDNAHRVFRNVDDSAQLTNATGRNDIVEARVAHDAGSVYFYAKTATPLSPASDPNWMLLFIDGDRDFSTGWQGYDFLIGKSNSADGHTTVYRFQDGDFAPAFQATIAYQGAELEIGVKKSDLGLGNTPSLDFHWADNIQHFGDITEFFLNGDSAPDRRFNYRYVGLPVSGAGGGAAGGSTGNGGSAGASGMGGAGNGAAAGNDARAGSSGASSVAGAAAHGGAGGMRAAGAGGEAGSSSGNAAPSASNCGCTLAAQVPARRAALSLLGIIAVGLRRRRRSGATR